jgi:hypothetical protein
MNKMVILLLSIFIINCSGTNPYLNNKNVMGAVGGIGSGVGALALCKNCNSTTKAIAGIGGTILGMVAFSKVGEYIDNRDVARQNKLMQDAMESNPDNMTSTDTYKKTWTNPNGQQQTGMVTQSITPLRTFQQPQNNIYVGDQRPSLPNGHPDKWKEFTYTQPQQYRQNRNRQIGSSLYSSNHYQTCRDAEITISIEGFGEPTKQQYYRACRTEQGWRSVQ